MRVQMLSHRTAPPGGDRVKGLIQGPDIGLKLGELPGRLIINVCNKLYINYIFIIITPVYLSFKSVQFKNFMMSRFMNIQ